MVVSLVLVTIDQNARTHHLTSGFKSVAADVVAPFRSVVGDIVHPIGSFFAGAVDYSSLQAQNEKLQAELGKLRQEETQRSFDERQLAEILALDHLKFLGSTPHVVAQTTALDISNFASTIQLDKGRAEGVAVGMPVVDNGGLVGRVIYASHHTSTVELLNDPQFKVGVTFGHPATLGIAGGQGAHSPLTVSLVPAGTHLHKGEVLFTNGLQGAEFPAGIPVGFVTAFSASPGSTQASVRAEPEANLNQLAFVDVVQWEPSS